MQSSFVAALFFWVNHKRLGVEKTVKADFNKNVVYDLDKKLLDKMDKISIAIEEFMLLNIVDFTPSLNIHATLEDIILQYEEKLVNKNK